MKQATLPLYIRFGEIPEDGKSRIWRDERECGVEPGLSVWSAVESYGRYYPLLPDDANDNAIEDYFNMLLESDCKVYLVTGDRLMFDGTDREPLLQNVKIIKDITHQYRQVQGV